MSKVSVLIPCFNESLTIKDVVCDFKTYIPDADIYVYDNCSTDNTDEIARQSGAIVKYSPVKGKGNVIRQMFSEVESDVYILVDGDSTYSAKDVSKLLELTDSYDMVIGDRLSSTYFTENKILFRNFGNRLVRFLVNFMFKSDVRDIMTGYRAFSKDFVKSFSAKSNNFEIETEMTIHAIKNGFNIGTVLIDYKDRPDGSKSKLNTVKDGMRVVMFIFKEFFNNDKKHTEQKRIV